LGDIGIFQYGYTEKASKKEVGPKFLRITDIDLATSQINWEKVPYCKTSEKTILNEQPDKSKFIKEISKEYQDLRKR
jgi:hypothetical protein